MLCQSKRKLKVLGRSQESTAKPSYKWKHHTRNLRWTHTLHVSFLSRMPHTYSPAIIFTLHTCPPLPFFSYCQEFPGKKCTNSSKGVFCSWPCGVLVHREVLRFGSRMHLWLCGIPLLSCFTQGLALEIPMPMPSQHHESSRTIPGIFPTEIANFSFCVLYIHTVSRKGCFSKFWMFSLMNRWVQQRFTIFLKVLIRKVVLVFQPKATGLLVVSCSFL